MQERGISTLEEYVARDLGPSGQAPVIYRFPGGSVNSYNKEVGEQINAEMNRLGFVYFDWNISSEDAAGKASAGKLLRNIKETPRTGTPCCCSTTPIPTRRRS